MEKAREAESGNFEDNVGTGKAFKREKFGCCFWFDVSQRVDEDFGLEGDPNCPYRCDQIWNSQKDLTVFFKACTCGSCIEPGSESETFARDSRARFIEMTSQYRHANPEESSMNDLEI